MSIVRSLTGWYFGYPPENDGNWFGPFRRKLEAQEALEAPSCTEKRLRVGDRVRVKTLCGVVKAVRYHRGSRIKGKRERYERIIVAIEVLLDNRDYCSRYARSQIELISRRQKKGKAA